MPTTREIALHAARAADAHKAEDLKVLDLRGLFVADYFVIGTILNRHHGRAIAEDLLQAAKERGERGRVEGLDDGTWVLVDLGDVVVHLFAAEYRKFYDLEMLWGDAPALRWRQPSAGAAAGKRKRAGAAG